MGTTKELTQKTALQHGRLCPDEVGGTLWRYADGSAGVVTSSTTPPAPISTGTDSSMVRCSLETMIGFLAAVVLPEHAVTATVTCRGFHYMMARKGYTSPLCSTGDVTVEPNGQVQESVRAHYRDDVVTGMALPVR